MTKGSVRQTATGWVADVTIDGQRKTALCKTKREALARKRELLEALLSKPATPVSSQLFTLHEARRLSLQVRWAGTSAERTAAINSQAAIDHFGGDTLLSEITTVQIDAWRRRLQAQGNRPATVNKKISALRAMFRDALMRGHIETAPTFPQQLRLKNTKDRTISDAERDGMCRYFLAIGQPAAADLLVFLLETAARWGEVERLRGEDVDLTARKVVFSETKANRVRSVPLTTRAVDAITPHLPAVGRHRVWPYTYSQFMRLFGKAKEAIGCGDDEALTVHTTRHTCASKLASRGIPLHQLMTFGGWTSLASVQRYLHLHTDALSACVAALED
jgi:integrase